MRVAAHAYPDTPEASAMLAGEIDPLTAWEQWSRFLESGGRFALELCAALLAVALSAAATPRKSVSLSVSRSEASAESLSPTTDVL